MTDEEGLRRILGPNAERFLRGLELGTRRRRRWSFGWCWPGLFFGSTWALYRRLYGPFLLVEAVVALGSAALVGAGLAAGSEALAAFAIVTLAVLLPRLFFLLLGRSLVVRDGLRRWRRLALEGPERAAAELVTWQGPLRTLRPLALAFVPAAIALQIALAGPETDAQALEDAIAAASAPEGLLALQIPLAIVVASLPAILAIALGCRWLQRHGAGWPGLGAVAIGAAAAFTASALPIALLQLDLGPLAPGERFLASVYLFTGGLEEAVKLVLLVAVLLPDEPLRRPRDAIVAALLMGAGFELVENAGKLLVATNLLPFVALRLPPRHLLFALLTGIGLWWYLRTGHRRRVLFATWLAAALAHGAFNHATSVLGPRWIWTEPNEAEIYRLVFRVDLEMLKAEWTGFAIAEAGIVLAVGAIAIILARRVLRAGLEQSPPASASASFGE